MPVQSSLLGHTLYTHNSISYSLFQEELAATTIGSAFQNLHGLSLVLPSILGRPKIT